MKCDLRGLRRSLCVSQETLANNLGKNQADISRLECRSDYKLSTLAEYVGGLGGRLKLIVTVSGMTVEIEVPK